MADYGFSEHAEATYGNLARDRTRWPVLDVVEDAILTIAADPEARQARGRRLQDPPCFAVPVRTPEGDWVVLWRPVADAEEFDDLAVGDVYVLYVGRLPD